MLRLLDFGITPTVVRFTAFHRGRKSPDDINALASTSIAVFILLGLFSIAIGLVVAWFLPAMIDLPADLERPAQVAAVIAALTLGLQAPLGLFSSLLKGAQRFDVLNAGGVVSIAVYAVLVIVVLQRHNTLPVLASLALIAALVLLCFPLFYIRRELPGLRLTRAAVSRSSLKGLLGFSWFAFLGHIAGKIVFSADVIVIGVILGAKEVALYGVATRLFGLVAGVASAGTAVLLPMQSELEGRGEYDRQRTLATQASAERRASGSSWVFRSSSSLRGSSQHGWARASTKASSHWLFWGRRRSSHRRTRFSPSTCSRAGDR